MKKKIRRVLCGLMVFMMMFQVVAVNGATRGEKLKELGMLSGDANGDLNEEGTLNRVELAILLSRLYGVEDEAKVYSVDQGFSDVAEGAWYYGYVNYAKSQGWMNGVSADKFDPMGDVSQEMATTVLLRVLGYNPNWGDATVLARGVGVSGYAMDPGLITRGEVFNYMYSALFTVVKDGSGTLGEELGLFDEDSYEESWIGYKYDMTNFDVTYKNLDGEQVNSDGEVYGTGIEIETVDDETFVIIDGVKEGPYSSKIIYGGNNTMLAGNYKGFEDGEKFIILDMDKQEVVAKGDIPLKDKYSISGFTKYGLQMVSSTMEFGYMIVDFDGNNIIDEKLIMYKPWDEDTLLYGVSDYVVVYDLKNNTEIYRGDFNMLEKRYKGGYIGYAASADSVSVTLLDEKFNVLVTMELDQGSFDEIKYEWMEYAEVLVVSYYTGSMVEDVATDSTYYQTTIDHSEVYGTDGERITSVEYYIAHVSNSDCDALVALTESDYSTYDFTYKLLSKEGEELDGVAYDRYSAYFESGIFTLYVDGVATEFESDGTMIDPAAEEPESISKTKTLFDDGYYAIYADYEWTVFGPDDKVVDEFLGVQLTFINELDYMIKGKVVYQHDGTVVTSFKDYDSIYSAMNRYVGGIKDGQSYIMDLDGSVLYGPVDGEYRYSVLK